MLIAYIKECARRCSPKIVYKDNPFQKDLHTIYLSIENPLMNLYVQHSNELYNTEEDREEEEVEEEEDGGKRRRRFKKEDGEGERGRGGEEEEELGFGRRGEG